MASSSSSQQQLGDRVAILAIFLAASITWLSVYPSGLPSLSGPRHSTTKPFKTLQDFYSHYYSEHQNGICRLLHITGSGITVSVLVRAPRLLLAVLVGLAVGVGACGATQGLPDGRIDAICLLLSYILSARWMNISWAKIATVPLIGYSFAWVGHFVFEQNKPATFLYPAYSLACDFVMCFRVLTGLEPLDPASPASLVDSITRIATGPALLN